MTAEPEKYPLSGRFLLGRSRYVMSDQERGIFEDSIEQVEEFGPSKTLTSRGEICDRSSILIAGFAVRTIIEHGRRQIVGIQVPGDFMDLHGFALKRLDHNLVTLGPATVGFVSHRRLAEIMLSQPRLTRLFWFSTSLDAAIQRQWTLKLGQLKADRRAAHFLAEIWHRLDLVGLGHRNGFRTPLTQADLADMCGTTPVHMNRALRSLSKAGIAQFRRGNVTVWNRKAFEQLADFNPAYLYGRGELYLGSAMAGD